MKNTKKSLLLVVLFSLSFSTISFCQEDVVITLYVNTAEITNQNEYQVSYFDGQEEGSDTRDYTVFVSPGDRIIWQGVSINNPETDVVNIKSINYQGGKNVFNRNVLNGDGDPKQVIGIVQEGTEGFEEKYKIAFTVYNNGRRRQGTFLIDPKIKVKQ